MRAYYFVKQPYGLENLEKRRLKIAQIMDLNDPFELAAPANSDHNQRYAFLQTKLQLSEKSGLICLSKAWNNPVMWSHYADRHTGICLGFDILRSNCVDVRYTTRRNLIDWEKFGIESDYGPKMMTKTLSTKFSHWKYEKEVRMFVELFDQPDENGNHFIEIGAALKLREVIVGAHSEISRNELDTALGGLRSEVVKRKARLAFRTFKVVNQMKASLWK